MDYAKVVTKNGQPAIENTGTTIPRFTNSVVANDNNYNVASSRWVENGSFVRVKNISLSYSLPNSLISKQKIAKSVRASLGAQNVFTFTKYNGFDPEVGSYVGQNANTGNQAIGVDFGRYPLTPIYTFSLGVNF
jgi:hypothetical protein